ncbi:MAG: geranylgeranyl reductase family protein [Bacteroidota bacterium]|nr:geranylgeranyl reductase family protein [Bacteroidota bacterium]
MNNKHYPIVIVGGGPAGATTSMYLTNFGIAHAIVEKGVFPRDKVCGDAVSGKGLDVIAKLHKDALLKFSEDRTQSLDTYGIQFVAPNGKGVDIPFPPPKADLPVGFLSKRLDFDTFLWDLSNSALSTKIQGFTAKKIEYTTNVVRCELSNQSETINITCDLIIGADGNQSVVSKYLSNNKHDDNHFCGGIRAYYSGVEGLHKQNFLELIFLPELLPGYFWIFPLTNGTANVGMGMLSADIKKRKVNMRKSLQEVIANNPQIAWRFKNAILEGRIEGCGLPLGSKLQPMSGDKFLLTGDAANLIDPFTGEGIGNAIVSGMVAARHAKRALDEKDTSAINLLKYDKEIKHKFKKELMLSYRIQRLTKLPKLFNIVVGKIHGSKELQYVFTNMFTDMDLRAKMKNPLFYVKLLFAK